DPEELFAGKPRGCCLAPFVPAKAGAQGQTHWLLESLGPRLRGDERRKDCAPSRASRPHAFERMQCIANAMLVPDLGRARESPSLCPFPHEGVGAPSRRGRRKETAPVGAPAAFPAFAFHGARTQAGP